MLLLDSSPALGSLTVVSCTCSHISYWLDVSDRIKFRLCVTFYSVYTEWHLVIYQSCADQFPHFKDDVTCVLPVSAILAFLVSDVTLTENGHLPTLAHLLGTHYLTI